MICMGTYYICKPASLSFSLSLSLSLSPAAPSCPGTVCMFFVFLFRSISHNAGFLYL